MNPLLFTDAAFLFFFAPVVLTGYWLVPATWRNGFLFAASIGLYAWGETRLVAVLLASIVVNWAAGWAIGRGWRAGLWLGIAGNLGLLIGFKYAPGAHMVAGISFYTFIGISYLVDLGRRDLTGAASFTRLGLLLSMFPHLVAGPIVRMTELGGQMAEPRLWNTAMVAAGVRRFVIGLGKKVLLANTLAVVPDAVFGHDAASAGLAWLALICYTLQIYYDFSGYSDMAIGLAGMLGFAFPENFNHPYAAKSVTEFWRRWHMTLSSWLRDYLFFPLGGKTSSLLLVFFICGIWHGAAWTFVCWGLWHGVLLCAERWGLAKNLPGLMQRLYTLTAVVLGWIVFRAATMTDALVFGKGLLGMGQREVLVAPIVYVALVVGGLGAARWNWPRVPAMMEYLGVAGLLIVSLAAIAGMSYQPFIYFRF